MTLSLAAEPFPGIRRLLPQHQSLPFNPEYKVTGLVLPRARLLAAIILVVFAHAVDEKATREPLVP
jgi:hypothetical protein